jgi:serine/threonine protein kinase
VENYQKWTGQIAHAIAFAHTLNFIHHAIRPTSILIDSNDNAFLSEFAFTRKVEDLASLKNLKDGLTKYSAPEMFADKGHDKAVDSWGII